MGGIGITGEESGLLGGGSLPEGAPFHKFLSLFLSSLLPSPLVPFPPLSLVLLLYHSRCFATGSFSRSPRALPAVRLPGGRKPLPALVCSTHLHAWGRQGRAECPLQPGCTRVTPPCDPRGYPRLGAPRCCHYLRHAWISMPVCPGSCSSQKKPE